MSDPLETFLAARIADGWMPGAAWWVEGARGVVSRGSLGLAVALPGPEPLTEETPFDLASLTKPLVSATLLVLFEQEGLLDLDAPVSSVLPALAGSAWAKASLLSLAVHTAGLPPWSPLYLEARSLEGYLGVIARLAPAIEPGRTLYSDLGYVLLGAVLQQVGGAGLDVLFEQRVARPLGLARTGFARRPGAFSDAAATEQGNAYERRMAGDRGAGHTWRRDVIRGEVHDANAHGLGGVAGHAGLFGPLGEVARLADELLCPAALPLGQRARDRLLCLAPSGRGRTVGMVVAHASSSAAGILPDTAPGHTGFTGTSLWLEPEAGCLFLLLTNRVHPRVPERNFQLLRRGFHRLALRIVRSRGG